MKYIFALLALLPMAAMAQVTITATPTTGTESVTPSVSWSAPAGSTCTASGGWTGAKAVSGTQAQAAITSTTTYTLSCVPPLNGSAALSWIIPDKNTDGTALTDLAGFKVYKGTTATNLTLFATINNPTAAAYTATGLSLGANYFSITAYNVAGVESVRSAVGLKTVTAPAAITASVTVTVDKRPNPPTNFQVTEVVAGINMAPVYKLTATGKRSADPAGFIPVPTACTGNVLFTYRGLSFRKVDYTKVQFWGTVASENVAAPCKST